MKIKINLSAMCESEGDMCIAGYGTGADTEVQHESEIPIAAEMLGKLVAKRLEAADLRKT